ncbi:MAG: T9SS type A sorting domain-containing protein [Bacteroidia bacterium]
MKKSLLIISTLFIGALGANAQITVTSADVASPVKVIYQSNDTLMTSGAIAGSSGPSQTWNMTSLTTGTVDTLTFISYGWAPDAAFPGSNLVAKQGSSYNFIYLNNSSSGLTSQGSKGTTDFGCGLDTLRQIDTPSEILMNFPATYNTSFTNNFKQVIPATYLGCDPGYGVTVDSVRMRSAQKKTVLVDAWGTLTTPLGTYNVIRSKETVIKHDTSDVMIFGAWNPFPGLPSVSADSTTGYTWWANGVGFPLVSMKLDSAGSLKQVQWLQSLPVTGINEYSIASAVHVYPNPAQDEINFGVDATKVSAIEVFDIAGRLVKAFNVNSDNSLINISGLANGEYSYAALGKDKVVINRGKFAVVR